MHFDSEAGNLGQGIPTERFDQVVGLCRAKDRLRAIINWLRNPEALERLGIRPPRGYLLAGPPGTGKTLVARALAGEARLPFFAVAPGNLQGSGAGETEKLIRQLFEQAERFAPSIVFIDEIDTIAPRRDEADWRGRQAVTQLLISMDGFQAPKGPVFVLGATNDADRVDPALLRPGRFDEVIPLDLPNREARSAFFALRLKNVPWEGEQDLERLASSTFGCSPAEMDRMVREATYSMLLEGQTAVTQIGLMKKIRQVVHGSEDLSQKVDQALRTHTAWHEAGHALVGWALLPCRKLDYVTIIPHERGALGFVATLPNETATNISATTIANRIASLLAGRAAEILFAGPEEGLTTGCRSDLASANSWAYWAITSEGLDPEFGLVSLPGLPPSIRSNFESRAAERVRYWLRQGQETAERVLKDHRDKLQALAEALLEQESLDGEAVKTLLEGPNG